MSYDLEVCVLGKCDIKSRDFENVYLDVDPSRRQAYVDTFRYMAEQDGTWCSIIEKGERFFSAMNLCDISGVKHKLQGGFPFWIEDIEQLYVIQILPEYKDTIINVLKYLLSVSPQNKIIFLPRLQGGENNNVCGVIKISDFAKLLDEGKILFNICYILEL